MRPPALRTATAGLLLLPILVSVPAATVRAQDHDGAAGAGAPRDPVGNDDAGDDLGFDLDLDLDLDGGAGDARETAPVEVAPRSDGGWETDLALAAVLAVLAAAAVAVWTWAGPSTLEPAIALGRMPAGARLLASGYLLILAVVHALGLWEVMLQTGEVWTSAAEYFRYMTSAKLVATTHNHLFGLATMYVITGGLFVAGARLPERVKAMAVFAALGGAALDLGCWWGIKYLGPRFELGSMAAGALFTGGFIFMAGAVLLQTWRGPHTPAPAEGAQA